MSLEMSWQAWYVTGFHETNCLNFNIYTVSTILLEMINEFTYFEYILVLVKPASQAACWVSHCCKYLS